MYGHTSTWTELCECVIPVVVDNGNKFLVTVDLADYGEKEQSDGTQTGLVGAERKDKRKNSYFREEGSDSNQDTLSGVAVYCWCESGGSAGTERREKQERIQEGQS